MSHTLTLVRMDLSASNLKEVLSLFEEVRQGLNSDGKQVGESEWRDPVAPMRTMIVLDFDEPPTPEQMERHLLDSMFATRLLNHMAAPPDIRHVTVVAHGGCNPQDQKAGEALSISTRIADPGYGQELMEDVEQVFANLQLMEGFTGFAYGTDLNIPEEVLGVALWKDDRAFQRSMPNHEMYDVQLYRRISR